MAVHIAAGFTGIAQPMDHPRIGWRRHTGTATATSAAAGFAAANAASHRTDSFWRPTALPAVWTLTPAAAVAFDYCGIAAHDLGTQRASVRVMRGGASRTNLAIRSQEVDLWALSNVTVNVDVPTLAPSGLMRADTMITTVDNTFHLASRTFTGATSTTYVASIWVQPNSPSWDTFRLGLTGTGFSPERFAWFDLGAGTVGTLTGSPTAGIEAWPNGWFRVWISAATTGSAGTYAMQVLAGNGTETTTFAGDAIRGFRLWGAQVEIGTVPTSYIPTAGAAVTSDLYQVGPFVAPADDDAVMILFPPEAVSALRLEVLAADAMPTLGVIQFGQVTELPRRALYAPSVSFERTKRTTFSTNQSQGGQWLGRSRVRQALAPAMAVAHLSEDWIATEFDAFAVHAETMPFFIADRPAPFPKSVAYAFSEGDLRASRDIPNAAVANSIDLQLTGFRA